MASSLGDAGITGTTLEMLAAKKTGPMPCGRSWKGLPVPFFFREDSAEAFKALDMRPDDVVCSSPVKAGTSWLHKILTLLLHGLDDEGRPIPVSSPVVESLLKMQIYPEACPMEPPAEPVPIAGLVSYPLLVAMPAPRFNALQPPSVSLLEGLLNVPIGAATLHDPPVWRSPARAADGARRHGQADRVPAQPKGCPHLAPLLPRRGQGRLAGQRARPPGS